MSDSFIDNCHSDLNIWGYHISVEALLEVNDY